MKKHGGRRKGAGRKATGSQPFLIRMMPETMGNLRAEARAKAKTVGTLLDWYFGPAWRKPKRVTAKSNARSSASPMGEGASNAD